MGETSPIPADRPQICVGIPAYGRCAELVELLQSIYDQTQSPAEITICEDKSPERDSIRAIVESWRERFASKSSAINYHENESNLGYDGNVRRVIAVSRSPWVMLMGNDDLLLPDCIETAQRFIAVHPDVPMISRSFVMFEHEVKSTFGVSRHSTNDQVYRTSNASPAMIFRLCGFVGGLIVNRQWGSDLATDRYDGSLYYQIYLGAEAFCEGGIGYISKPIVGSRAGNPPLFGSAPTEKEIHVPGSYTPLGRARMWESVLRIADDAGQRHGIELLSDIKEELEVRQSFHVFEMMAGAGRQRLSELRREFQKLDLFGHPLPWTLYAIDMILGSRADVLFRLARRLKSILQVSSPAIRHGERKAMLVRPPSSA
jgi:abequosyltransferase